ncbi:sulfatase, partial [Verrucomicrobiota bacterium]
LLRRAGLKTITFSPFAERHSAWHWYSGFAEIHDTGRHGHEIADDVTPGVLDWLGRNAAHDNWFLHVNYWDAHTPYRTPPEFGEPFADEPLPDNWMTEGLIADHVARPGTRSALDAIALRHKGEFPRCPATIESLQDFRQLIDGYDTGILYADTHIGRILDRLDSCGVLEDTAIIVSADHGDALGELNAYGGHCFADYYTTRVPLIIRWPGVTDSMQGHHDTALRHQFDMAATVCELMRAPLPDVWDAQSFAALFRGEASSGRDYLVCSQLAQACQRSVRFRKDDEDYFLTRTYRDAFYFLDKTMLFELHGDPHQLSDLSSERPEIVKEGLGMLDSWRDAMLANSPNPDPIEKVLEETPENPSPPYVQRLRETGRGDWAHRLAKREGLA